MASTVAANLAAAPRATLRASRNNAPASAAPARAWVPSQGAALKGRRVGAPARLSARRAATAVKAIIADPVDSAADKKTGDPIKIGINGFGRIGRLVMRVCLARDDVEIVAVNDPFIDAKYMAYMLKYDTVHGKMHSEISSSECGEFLIVGGKKVRVFAERDPANIKWGESGVKTVVESTGVFTTLEKAQAHIDGGAEKVVISAPSADAPMFVMGVNEDQYSPDLNIVSNASCTTNCLAPFVKVLDEKFGIVKGTMTTTHSYTGDQRLLDASHRDLRRARAAALSIVPTTTGAAKAVALVLPQLKGKLNGIALRVPTPNVSVVDLVIQVEKKTFAEEVNAAFKEAMNGPMKGILAIEEKPLVSIDYRCSDVSTTIDAALTMVMGDDMVKVVAWYDNEWGYSQRVVDLAEVVAKGGC
mmetsp:Transcript_31896/g.82560  ORF Transcript_31896/g.82560 Transcript_31896/m.82560 type:complete len:416 (+) Transcript_31896:162-1409(+)